MTTAMELEARFGVANYDPLPVVLTRSAGCQVWDINGPEYLGFMSADSTVSDGREHPRLVRALGVPGQANRTRSGGIHCLPR